MIEPRQNTSSAMLEAPYDEDRTRLTRLAFFLKHL
jgi:hypothetical protein